IRWPPVMRRSSRCSCNIITRALGPMPCWIIPSRQDYVNIIDNYHFYWRARRQRAILSGPLAIQDALRTNTRSTRWLVVRALRARGNATVNDLAEAVGVKPVTVRHHLTSLHAEGLVEVQEERQGVGRPVHVYHLTRKAEQLFPHTYHLLIDRLLDEIKETFPPEIVQQLIDSLANSMAQDIRREIAGLPEEARRERLVEWLEEQGVAARWRQADDGLHFVKYYCPYYAVGEEHPELCRIDEA